MADEQAGLGYEERISHSEQCCEGYGYGRYSARKRNSVPEPNDSTSSYLLGFRRGMAAAHRWSRGESSVEKQLREPVYQRIEWLDHTHYKNFTEEEAQEWRSLQTAAVMFGNKNWEDLLLDLHYQLGLYSEGARSAPVEEKEAMRIVQHGIIRRLAETSLSNS
jgi:hypothetical protein